MSENLTPAEAAREIGWLAREAAALADSAPPAGASVEARTEYVRRWEEYKARKRRLVAYIESPHEEE